MAFQVGDESLGREGYEWPWPFRVDANVPIPPKRGGTEDPAWASPWSDKYPFEAMSVGDSFLVPWVSEEVTIRKGQRDRVNVAAQAHKRGTGRAYTLRSLEDGVRVWRVE